MGDGGKVDEEDGGSAKFAVDDLQDIHPGSAPIWELKMGGHKCEDDSDLF